MEGCGLNVQRGHLGASVVAPGHTQVLPLPPVFIAPQDGAEKQDCERDAAKRCLPRHGPTVAHPRPVYLGDDLFAFHTTAHLLRLITGDVVFRDWHHLLQSIADAAIRPPRPQTFLVPHLTQPKHRGQPR
jgi:hypothetical protein